MPHRGLSPGLPIRRYFSPEILESRCSFEPCHAVWHLLLLPLSAALDQKLFLSCSRWLLPRPTNCLRSEEHTSELQSLLRISYAVCCLQKQKLTIHITNLN